MGDFEKDMEIEGLSPAGESKLAGEAKVVAELNLLK